MRSHDTFLNQEDLQDLLESIGEVSSITFKVVPDQKRYDFGFREIMLRTHIEMTCEQDWRACHGTAVWNVGYIQHYIEDAQAAWRFAMGRCIEYDEWAQGFLEHHSKKKKKRKKGKK